MALFLTQSTGVKRFFEMEFLNGLRELSSNEMILNVCTWHRSCHRRRI